MKMQMTLMSLHMTTVQPAVQQHRCLQTSWTIDEEVSKQKLILGMVLLKILRCSVILSAELILSEGAVASLFGCSSPDRAFQIRALLGNAVLCSWARHFTLTVPFSAQGHK